MALLAAMTAMTQMIGDVNGDGDGALNTQEFRGGGGANFGDGSAFRTRDGDADGKLSDVEDIAGVFNSYDDDGSGAIAGPEFGDVGDDIGDGSVWDV